MSKVTMLRRSARAVQEVLQGHRERSLAALPRDFSTASLSGVASSQNVAAESSASAGTAAAASAGASEPGVAGPLKQSLLWKLVKSSVLVAAAGVAGGAAYMSYAYDVDTVEQKLSALKSGGKLSFDDSNFLDKLRSTVYTSAVGAAVSVADFYVDTRKNLEGQIRDIAAPTSSKLLPDLPPHDRGILTIVLDLNETLVYSDWKRDRGWRTFKRPGVEAFLEQLAQYYEVVVYTDQLSFYADPVLEKLDQKGCISFRLVRDATQYVDGKHFRDLEKLNRDPSHVIYLSGHAKETTLQPENALSVKPWKLEPDDTVLLDMLPFLEFVARSRPADIRPVLASYDGLDVPTEFRERTKELQRKLAERKQTNLFWRGRQ